MTRNARAVHGAEVRWPEIHRAHRGSPLRASIRTAALFPVVVAMLSISAVRADGPAFLDVTDAAGIDWVHTTGASGEKILLETMAGGAGWFDYDRDGHLDLYLVDGHSSPRRAAEKGDRSNRLYRNMGDGTFVDVTEKARVGDKGYGFGLAVGDYDNDGDLDLYVTNYGPNVLYRNEGDGTFVDVTSSAGVTCPAWSTSAAFFDADGDGWLDLYVANYLHYDAASEEACRGNARNLPSYCHPNRFSGAPDSLFLNQRDGTFRDISKSAGIAVAGPATGKGLGVLPVDFDLDGRMDVFVANDSVPNFLWRNVGGGRFIDAAIAAGVALDSVGRTEACMGIAFADMNLDGFPDWLVTNFSQETDTLYLSEANGFYEDATDRLGLGSPTWLPLGFGTGFFDYDLDGDLDLFIARGHILDNIAELHPEQSFAQTDQLLENIGDARKPRFRDASASAGPYFSRKHVGRGTAFADYDNDGDLDLLVVNLGERPALLASQAADQKRGHWIGFELVGAPGSSPNTYGSRIAVHTSTGVRYSVVEPAWSYLAANDPRILLGLGDDGRPMREVRVRWPDGHEERFVANETGRYHRLVRGKGSPVPKPAR